ncbi:MAG: hypothetical protein ACK49R_19640, partial [Planctomycetota bacterium]
AVDFLRCTVETGLGMLANRGGWLVNAISQSWVGRQLPSGASYSGGPFFWPDRGLDIVFER